MKKADWLTLLILLLLSPAALLFCWSIALWLTGGGF